MWPPKRLVALRTPDLNKTISFRSSRAPARSIKRLERNRFVYLLLPRGMLKGGTVQSRKSEGTQCARFRQQRGIQRNGARYA